MENINKYSREGEWNYMQIFLGLIIPLIGTTLGAGCVFFMRKELNHLVQNGLMGFAAGVMVAASVWSLLIPAMEMSDHLGKFAFGPAAIGFMIGIGFLLAMDKLIPHLHIGSREAEGPSSNLKKTTMLILAVTIHNIPEGFSIGAIFAGILSGNQNITLAGAFALSIGIAIQNFPEGAIISMPLRAEGYSKRKSFLYGTLSGVVEPIAAAITLVLASFINPLLPYMLSFAAGAMVYVVVEELIPEASQGEHSNVATIGFAIGFVIMMVLDVALG